MIQEIEDNARTVGRLDLIAQLIHDERLRLRREDRPGEMLDHLRDAEEAVSDAANVLDPLDKG